MSGEETVPDDIGGLLRRLTETYVGASAREDILRTVSRLLDSAITTAPSLKGVDSLVHSLLTRLMRDGRHNEAMRFAELAAALKVAPGFSSSALWSILYALSALRGTSAEEPRRSNATDNADTQLPAETVQEIQATSPASRADDAVVPNVSDSPFVPGDEEPQGDSGADETDDARVEPVAGNGLSKSASDVEDDALRMRKAASQVKSHTAGAYSLAEQRASHSVALEETVVRDLLLIVQGDDGQNIKFVGPPGEEAVQFATALAKKLSQPMHDIASAVSELGFLFRVVRRRLDKVDEERDGLVMVNFCHAVDKELDMYYKSIMTIRGALDDTVAGSGQSGPKALTLRRLYVWAEGEKDRIRCMARLCDEVVSLRGGQILAHLGKYRTSYLAPELQNMLSRVFSRSASPLHRMLQRWLTEGVLDDPYEEFFIMVDKKVAAAAAAASNAVLDGSAAFDTLIGGPNAASAASNRIWWGLYRVRHDMLPSAANRAVTEKALVAGKSVAFLRLCCDDSVWVDSVHAPSLSGLFPGRGAICQGNEMLGLGGFATLVEKADASASKRLMSLFFDKFDLSHHFAAIKKYLLLSQGDFTQSLIDSLAKILDESGEIFLNNLTGLVDAALRSASSFNEETDQDILDRLNVRVLQRSVERGVGWDVFSLTYRVEDAPLNTVFSSKIMDAYLLIFRFLWRLKRMDHLLSESYMSLCAHKKLPNENSAAHIDDLKSALGRAHYIRMKMTHLVQNIQYYCTFEVLEGSWTVLERDMASAENLSALIDAHSRYLIAIKERTLLSDRSRVVLDALNATLDTIPTFHDVQQRLSREVSVYSSKSRSFAGDSEYDFSPRSLSDDTPPVHRLPTDEPAPQVPILAAIEEIEGRFDKNLITFLDALRAHTTTVDSCTFLAFRLDFNGYFGDRRASASEES